MSRVDGPEIPNERIVATLVFDVLYLASLCHAEGSYLATDHLFFTAEVTLGQLLSLKS
jgi:hypothetical protein